MPKYKYEKLGDEQKYFRLLKLLPGGGDEPLKCELKKRKVQSPGDSYGAMSYVWGDEKNQSTIHCHGGEVQIPTNLKKALKELRYKTHHRFLWADSICINQDNEKEKENQILVMGSIYRQAEKVYVWLGNTDEKAAFTLLGSLSNVPNEKFRERAEKRPSSEWKSLSRVLKLDWFERVWTLQEIGLASHATVRCRHSRIDWYIFKTTCQRIHDTCKQLRLKYDLRLYRVSRTDVDFRHGTEGPGFLMKLVRERKCSNKIDRINGILGHVFFERFEKEHHRPFINPKTLDSEHMDYAVTKELLKLPEPLYTLSLVQQDKKTMFKDGYPSWVPRLEQKTFISVLADETKNDGSWTAGGKLEHENTLTRDNKVLTTPGLEVDRVKWQSEKITNSIKDGDKHHLIAYIWDQMKKRGKERGYLEEKSIEEFCNVFHLEGHFAKSKGSPSIRKQKANCLAYFAKNNIKVSIVENPGNQFSDGKAEDFFPDVLHHCRNRRFIVTEKGDLGLAPAISEQGDKVCVFFGGQVPFLLRPVNGKYGLCGECFVIGLMDGQAIDKFKSEKIKRTTFKLV